VFGKCEKHHRCGHRFRANPMVLFGPCTISDLIPECASKRTFAHAPQLRRMVQAGGLILDSIALAAEPPLQHLQPVIAEKHLVVVNESRYAEDTVGESERCCIGQSYRGFR